MSGGHFDYLDNRLEELAEQLTADIKNNDIPYQQAVRDQWGCVVQPAVDKEGTYGYQWEAEALEYMQRMVDELRRLRTALHEYDYAVSGDSSKQRFLNTVRSLYGSPSMLRWTEQDLQLMEIMRETHGYTWPQVAEQMSKRKGKAVTANACKRAASRLDDASARKQTKTGLGTKAGRSPSSPA